MFSRLGSLVAAATIMLGIGAGATAQETPSYSATAVHSIPGQAPSFGTVISSGDDLRLEYEQNGQTLIQIIRPTLGVMYVLDPTNKSYMEIRGQAVPSTAQSGNASPCPDDNPALQCQMTGTDKVSGITVQKWSITAQGQTINILWNVAREKALQQEVPGGGLQRYSFIAMEDLNGRLAEHWQITLTIPGQDTQTGDWWYDPALKLTLREVSPLGEINSLENVSVGPVDPTAFEVPADYHKVEMIAPQTGTQ